MSGLGGLNKSAHGVVVGLVQLQLPNVKTPAELAAQTQRICDMVGKARRNQSTMDLVVFPEYALHGLSMDTNPEIMCRLDGPEVAAFKRACIEHRIWGCFSIMEANPGGNPYNSGLIIDDQGEVKLYYRKLHPWVPVEPWEPGNVGVPVCRCATDPTAASSRSSSATTACSRRWRARPRTRAPISSCARPATPHRSAMRGASPTRPTPSATSPTPRSVCLCGSDGSFDSMGEGIFCNFDGRVLVEGGGRVDEIITAELRPDLVREARTGWGVENNIYQLYHRGYVAVKGGAQDCPYTYMHDMAAGTYRLPWSADVKVTDGTSCGFAPPERNYQG